MKAITILAGIALGLCAIGAVIIVVGTARLFYAQEKIIKSIKEEENENQTDLSA